MRVRLPSGLKSGADWLVVGLGNPGDRYRDTRHNVGFKVLRALCSEVGAKSLKPRFTAELLEGVCRSERQTTRFVAVLPQTFMNESGRAVSPVRGLLKLPPESVVVVHDEIDLPFGTVKARSGGGLAGHNGLKSVAKELGSREFWRVRVGVGRPESTDRQTVSSYVLGRFSESSSEVQELVETAKDTLVDLLVSRQEG